MAALETFLLIFLIISLSLMGILAITVTIIGIIEIAKTIRAFKVRR